MTFPFEVPFFGGDYLLSFRNKGLIKKSSVPFTQVFLETLSLRFMMSDFCCLKFIRILCAINQLNRRIMAMSIKSIPVLTGQAAANDSSRDGSNANRAI